MMKRFRSDNDALAVADGSDRPPVRSTPLPIGTVDARPSRIALLLDRSKALQSRLFALVGDCIEPRRTALIPVPIARADRHALSSAAVASRATPSARRAPHFRCDR